MRLTSLVTPVAVFGILALAACSDEPEPTLPTVPNDAPALTVEAPSFTNGALVRPRFTCDGVNLSPEVTWSGMPTEAQSIAIVLNDPDAPGGSYIHWLVYDLPPTVDGLGEADGKAAETTPQGGAQTLNSAGDLGYTGPCPPRGETHTYEMHVYALDRKLDLAPLTARAEVIAAMEGAVVGHGVFSARYLRDERDDENVVFKITPTP